MSLERSPRTRNQAKQEKYLLPNSIPAQLSMTTRVHESHNSVALLSVKTSWQVGNVNERLDQVTLSLGIGPLALAGR